MRTDTERNLGAVIRARRLTMKMSLVQVSRATGVDISDLSKIERGLSRTSVARYDRIAKALSWTPAQMWGAATGRRAA